LASKAPIREARTISISPARSATIAMMSSGRLPNVALRSPPRAGPVRAARCSVLCTIRFARGTMARAAPRKMKGAATPMASIAAATGIRISSQWIDGLRVTRGLLDVVGGAVRAPSEGEPADTVAACDHIGDMKTVGTRLSKTLPPPLARRRYSLADLPAGSERAMSRSGTRRSEGLPGVPYNRSMTVP
jgi:hypothetical protein